MIKWAFKVKHFCENEAFLKCQRYPTDPKDVRMLVCDYKEKSSYVPSKGYVFGQDKCKLANNDELNYEQKKSL